MRRDRRRAPLWPWGLALVMALIAAGAIGHYGTRQPVRVVVKHVAGPSGSDLATQLNASQFTGVAAVYRANKRVQLLVRGDADRRRGLANRVDTMFEIDSVQKALTAGLVMNAIRAGQLKMTTRLSRFYPAVPGADVITIRQLLDMTSGLAVRGPFLDATYTTDAARVARLARRLTFDRRFYQRGRYLPANYVLLCGILAQVTHRSYQQLFTQTYIKPLGLHHTRFAYQSATANTAVGYGWGDRGLANAAPQDTSARTSHQELGTGQVFMSVDDLFKVESALVSGRLLTPNATAWLFAPGSVTTYGGGLYQAPGFRLANGYGYGFQCFMRISASGQDAVIVLANCNPPHHVIEQAANRLANGWLK